MHILRTTDVQLEDLLSDLEDEEDIEKEEENEGFEENELLENIIDEDVFSAQPPIVDSGEDREVEPTDDGTVTVTLDGRRLAKCGWKYSPLGMER